MSLYYLQIQQGDKLVAELGDSRRHFEALQLSREHCYQVKALLLKPEFHFSFEA